jgi:hypothetical protein
LMGYHSSAMPPGTVQLPDNAPFSFTNVPNTFYYANWAPLKGLLLGIFGTDTQLAHATHMLVENNDYNNILTTTVTGSENLSVFDATTGVWTATSGKQAALALPPGGGVLVGLASAVPVELRHRDQTLRVVRPGDVVLGNGSLLRP